MQGLAITEAKAGTEGISSTSDQDQRDQRDQIGDYTGFAPDPEFDWLDPFDPFDPRDPILITPLDLPQTFPDPRREDVTVVDFDRRHTESRLKDAAAFVQAETGRRYLLDSPDWQQTFAEYLVEALKHDGYLFPRHYILPRRSTFPVAIARQLTWHNIAEAGYDMTDFERKDAASFAARMSPLSGRSLENVLDVLFLEEIHRVAEEMGLRLWVSREQIQALGFDPAGLTDKELRRFAAKVHREMAGFDPAEYPQEFDRAICWVAQGPFHLPPL